MKIAIESRIESAQKVLLQRNMKMLAFNLDTMPRCYIFHYDFW